MALDTVGFVMTTEATFATPQVTAPAIQVLELAREIDHPLHAHEQVGGLTDRFGLASREISA